MASLSCRRLCQPSRRDRRHDGFTLTELLIVIVVLAILLAIAVPAISRSIDSAKTMGCAANLRSLGVAFGSYQMDNQFLIPGDDSAFGLPENVTWLAALAPYCDVISLSACPAAKKPGDGTFDNGGGNKWGGYKNAWELGTGSWMRPPAGPDHASYALNMWSRRDFMSNSVVESERASFGSTRVDNLTRIPLIMDGRWEGIWPVPTDPIPPRGSLEKAREIPINGSNWRMVDNVAMRRHGVGVNICFMDGSVRLVDVNDLWTLKWNKNYPDQGPQDLR